MIQSQGGMNVDPRELAALSARLERLRAKQAELDALQSLMANQIMTIQKAIEAEAAALRALQEDASVADPQVND